MTRVRPDPKDTPLLRAARNNDFDGVVGTSLLDHTDPNSTDSKGNTALLHLAWHGNLAGIEIMRASGADLNHVNKDGDAALHLAILAHHPQAAHALIEAGADADLPNASGLTALHMMARSGDTKGVSLALKHDADPAYKNKRTGKTALDYAQEYQRPEVIKTLQRRNQRMSTLGKIAGLIVTTENPEDKKIAAIYGDDTPNPVVRDLNSWKQEQKTPKMTTLPRKIA